MAKGAHAVPSKKTAGIRSRVHWFLLLAGGAILWTAQEPPKDLQAMLINAERNLDWQYYEEAQSSYLEILQLYPELSGLNETLGYIYMMRQKYDESFACFAKELARGPGNELARLLSGIAHYQAGDAATARTLVEKVANNHSATKGYPFFKKFMKDNPGLLPFVMGILYKERGEWQYAEEMLDEAAEEKYCLAEVMVQLVDQYLQQQDDASAALVLGKLERENSQLAEQLRAIEKSRDRQKAKAFARSRPIIIRYFKEPISVIVNDLNEMAQNAVKRADPESAFKTWKKALFADDNRFDIHYNLALIYSLYNFQPEALYHCRRAIDLGNSQYQPWALNLAGNIQFEMGNFEQARDYYQQAIDLDPKYLKCRNNLGAAYWKLGDLPNAKQEWLRVIKNSGRGEKERDVLELAENEKIKVLVDVKESDEIIEAGKSLAALYIRQQQAAQAIPLLQMVLQFIPSDADAHFELGKLYMQTGDLALARQHLETAVRNGTASETEARSLCAEIDKRLKSSPADRD
jgi:tetratricopeptide (TPR) repeat protein